MDWSLLIAGISLAVSTSTAAGPPLYRRLIQRPRLRFHKSGALQILFGPYGPGLQLVGTIQAIHAQQFLSSIQIVIRHVSTGEEHRLVWRLTFPDVFVREPGSSLRIDMPVGVMINPQAAYRFQAFFNDPNIEDGDIREIKDRLQREWFMLLSAAMVKAQTEASKASGKQIVNVDEVSNDAFRQLMEQSTFQWAKQRLESTQFWKPGTYHLTVRSVTAEPDNHFDQRWRFKLSEANIGTLRFNTDFAVGELAGYHGVRYNNFYGGCTVDYLPYE